MSILTLRRALAGLCACGALFAAALHAEPATRASIEAWLAEPPPATLPTPGATLNGANLESLRGLFLPGYFDDVLTAGVPLEIEASGDFAPAAEYRAVSTANAGKATLKAAGGMDGYVAGQPFDASQIAAAPVEQAGYMVAWNNVHRWQYYGYHVQALDMIIVSATAPGTHGTLMAGMEGGSNAERSMVQEYHRVYLNHLAMLPNQGYRVKADDADKRFYKDYISFTAPFDVKGTTFVVERSLDPNEEDQVSSYLPKERRVRRLSAQERADKFMGTNWTLDDFEAFSGRVMDYEWIYRGRKPILHVTNSREPVLRFGGQLSDVPIDRWQVRDCFVVELKPRWKDHPVASKYLFVDAQTWNGLAAIVVDRQDRAWRFFMPYYQWAATDSSTPERAWETSVLRWRGAIGVDLIEHSTSIARATVPTEIPTMGDKQIERKFSVSNLSGGH